MNNQFIYSLITGVFVGGTAGYLGSLMMSKKMALVAGPLGHLTLPGIALALLYDFDVSLGALPFVVLGAILIWFLQMRTNLPGEALTAVVFSVGVASSFLLLPSEDLESALVGDISQVGWREAFVSAVICVIIFLILRKIYYQVIFTLLSEDLARVEGIAVNGYNFFYFSCIAVIVALGVKMVGGLLTAALVAIPACTARNLTKGLKQYSLGALAVGGISSVSGIVVANLTSAAVGPLIILCSAFFFIISVFFKRQDA